MLRTLLLIFPLVLIFAQTAWAGDDLDITADAAILIDARTGQVLYEQNADQQLPPASTTKIATALVALEMGELDSVVTVSNRAASTGESSMRLQAGEQLTLNQLITGALVRSGNDACVAIAEHLAGTEDGFISLVNNRTKFLGAKNSAFVNSNGLPARGHLSSAGDLALITRYALLNETFRKIVGTQNIIIKGRGHWVHSLTNTNKLLWEYPGTTGVKTGTTVEAGQCLVASAQRGDMYLISVVLHSSDRYNDTVKLMDYGFNNFEPRTLVHEGEILKKIEVKNGSSPELWLAADRSLVFLCEKGEEPVFEKQALITKEPEAPVKRGNSLGKMRVTIRGDVIGYANLMAKSTVDREHQGLILLKRFATRGNEIP